MKKILVTLIDTRTTRENPIMPETIVIEQSEVAAVVEKHLDKNHHLHFAGVPSSFSYSPSQNSDCNLTCENVDCD